MNAKSKKQNAQRRVENKRAARKLESRRKRDTKIQRMKTAHGVARKLYGELQQKMKLAMEARAAEQASNEAKDVTKEETPKEVDSKPKTSRKIK